MVIACIGWGSWVWDPQELPIISPWHEDGPFAPVELVRQTMDGRITLVIDKDSAPVRLLWAKLGSPSLAEARGALKEREKLLEKDWEKEIGSWEKGQDNPAQIPHLRGWAAAHGVEAVVWSNLGPKFKGREERPSAAQVIQHLQNLYGAQLEQAKKYIEYAPRQIDTAYRRAIQTKLGWTYTAPK